MKPVSDKSTAASSENRCVLFSIETSIGTFVAHYSDSGLCELDFPGRSRRGLKLDGVANSGEPVSQWHALTAQALRSVLSGRNPAALPPLDISRGTSFQQSVWRAMLEIRCGETRSYGDIAKSLGNPGAVRAVGAACGANPIPVLIPCHRVLAANKRIGGFSSGLEWKRKLLALENIDLFA